MSFYWVHSFTGGRHWIWIQNGRNRNLGCCCSWDFHSGQMLEFPSSSIKDSILVHSYYLGHKWFMWTRRIYFCFPSPKVDKPQLVIRRMRNTNSRAYKLETRHKFEGTPMSPTRFTSPWYSEVGGRWGGMDYSGRHACYLSPCSTFIHQWTQMHKVFWADVGLGAPTQGCLTWN